MSKPIFMSPEHIARMNELLANDAATRSACATLERRWEMAYELSHGMQTVWWTMSFDPIHGVVFTLAPPQRPADILFRGEHRAALEWIRRTKAGDTSAPTPLVQSGNPNAMSVIQSAFVAAQKAATLETEIPSAPSMV